MSRPTYKSLAHKSPQKEKTLKAFATYLDLLDTAEWMRREMSAPLESFGLTMGDFRMLELLHREGPMSVPAAAEKRHCRRPNLDVILAHMEGRGWVRRKVVTLPPVEIKESRLPIAMRGRKRQGRRIIVWHLTPLGKKFIGVVFPKHAKLVKAFMRVLDAREKDSLRRICHKLRIGDVRKFVSELTHEDVDDLDS